MSYNKREVKMKEGLLLSKVRQHVSRQMIVGGVLMIATLMIFNVGSFTRAANSDTSNLNVNIAAGSLTIHNVDAQLDFASGTSGTSAELAGELHNIFVKDYRDGPGRWTLYGNSSALNYNGATNIPAYNVVVKADEAAIVNEETFNTELVGASADNTLNGNIALFNSDHNNTGIVAFNSMDINVTVNATLPAGDYSGTMKLTVIATS